MPLTVWERCSQPDVKALKAEAAELLSGSKADPQLIKYEKTDQVLLSKGEPIGLFTLQQLS